MIPPQLIAKLGFLATKNGLYLLGAIVFLVLIFCGYHEIKSSGAEEERAKWETKQRETEIKSDVLIKDAEKRIEIQKQKEDSQIKKIEDDLHEKNADISAADRNQRLRIKIKTD